MPINIRNREVEALLNELKRATGAGTTEIVLDLTRREVARLRRIRALDERRQAIEALTARYRSHLEGRLESPEQIIGYDTRGLPR
jgi:hypothetical protein